MKESRTLVVDCFICEVAAGRRRASVVLDDAGIVAFADLRQRGERPARSSRRVGASPPPTRRSTGSPSAFVRPCPRPCSAEVQDMAARKENARASIPTAPQERVLYFVRAARQERRRGGVGAGAAVRGLYRRREQGAGHPRDRALRGQAESRDRSAP